MNVIDWPWRIGGNLELGFRPHSLPHLPFPTAVVVAASPMHVPERGLFDPFLDQPDASAA